MKYYVTLKQSSGMINPRINSDIKVFPNPAINGNFTISGIESIRRIELTDLYGRKITVFSNLNQPSINIQVTVPKGIYAIILFDGQQMFWKQITI